MLSLACISIELRMYDISSGYISSGYISKLSPKQTMANPLQPFFYIMDPSKLLVTHCSMVFRHFHSLYLLIISDSAVNLGSTLLMCLRLSGTLFLQTA